MAFDTAAHFRASWAPLRDYLNGKGAGLPARAPERRLKIVSPVRRENTASFDVYPGDSGDYRWTDWGDTGPDGRPASGTIIDLLILHEQKITTVEQAIAWLCERYGDPVPADRPGTPDDEAGRRKCRFTASVGVSASGAAMPTPSPVPSLESEVADEVAGPDDGVEEGVERGFFKRYANHGVTSKIGTGYLASRGLSPRVHGLLYDCCWSPLSEPDRKFYGVGLPNLKGDWNVRCGMRDKARARLLVRNQRDVKERGGLSVVKVGAARTWDVAEGTLSGMALVDAGFCDGALLVLNGAGNARRAALDILTRTAAHNPDVLIRLHLDGDDKAVGATTALLDLVPTARDYRPIYLAQRDSAGGDPLDFWAADPAAMLAALEQRTTEIEDEIRIRKEPGIAA